MSAACVPTAAGWAADEGSLPLRGFCSHDPRPENLIAEFVAYGDPFRSGITPDLVRGLDERAHQRFLLGGAVTRQFRTDLVEMNRAVHKVKIIFGHAV